MAFKSLVTSHSRKMVSYPLSLAFPHGTLHNRGNACIIYFKKFENRDEWLVASDW